LNSALGVRDTAALGVAVSVFATTAVGAFVERFLTFFAILFSCYVNESSPQQAAGYRL
jgi:hypothetical protein